jgi:hypothetical protein
VNNNRSFQKSNPTGNSPRPEQNQLAWGKIHQEVHIFTDSQAALKALVHFT